MKYLLYLGLFFFFLLCIQCSSSPSTKEISSMDKMTIRGDENNLLSSDAANRATDVELEIEAGALTAGQWADLEAWDFWRNLIEHANYQDYQEYWELYPQQRYDVRIIDALGQPACDLTVQLVDPLTGVLWEAKTNAQGIASLWAEPFIAAVPASQELELVVLHQNKTIEIGAAIPFEEGIVDWQLSPKVKAGTEQLEVLFVVDATGSMEDEINYLKAELQDVMLQYQLSQPATKLRLGSIFYRDYPLQADYLTKVAPLSDDYEATFNFINEQEASGGGDFPEAVEAALAQAVQEQNWSDSRATRLMFLLLDAPAHHTPESLKQLQENLKLAAAKGIRIIPIASSGVDKETEFLMRLFSILTGGTYVFITDHSGIGKGHIEPTIGDYKVQYLNDLLLELLQKYTTPSVSPMQ